MLKRLPIPKQRYGHFNNISGCPIKWLVSIILKQSDKIKKNRGLFFAVRRGANDFNLRLKLNNSKQVVPKNKSVECIVIVCVALTSNLTNLKLTWYHRYPPAYFFILNISMHLLLWMNVLLGFICMGFAEL